MGSNVATALLVIVLGALVVSHVQMRMENSQMRSKIEELEDKTEGLEDKTEELEEKTDVMLSELGVEDMESVVNGTMDFDRLAARRLGGIMNIGTDAKSGCFAITTATLAAQINLNNPGTASANCGASRCPACFIRKDGVGGDDTQQFNNPGSAHWKSAALTSGSYVREYVFINQDEDNTLTIRVGGVGGPEFILAPLAMTYAVTLSGYDYFMYQSNYGIVDTTGIVTCPDGCSGATVYKASSGAAMAGAGTTALLYDTR